MRRAVFEPAVSQRRRVRSRTFCRKTPTRVHATNFFGPPFTLHTVPMSPQVWNGRDRGLPWATQHAEAAMPRPPPAMIGCGYVSALEVDHELLWVLTLAGANRTVPLRLLCVSLRLTSHPATYRLHP